MRKRYLGLLAILVATPTLAATNMHQLSLNLCHSQRKNVRALWQHERYATTPAVAHMMLLAVDGKSTALRHALAAMPPKAARKWRQSALGFAALEGHADTVVALLADGAAADAPGSEPPLKSAFYNEVLGDAAHSPHLGGAKGVAALQKKGLINNKPRKVAPAIYYAIQCDDLTTVKVLLRHHVDPMHQMRPHGADPFSIAVLDGDTDITQTFLAHGASPCLEDARIAWHWKRDRNKGPVHTLASIGKDDGLPPQLVHQLTCQAPPASSR